MTAPEPRRVRLVLVDRDGTALGRTQAFDVATPWWQHAGAVVAGARERLGIRIVVLRVLETERGRPPGGLVTYLAETDAATTRGLALERWSEPLDDHPLRMPWARPDGPALDLAWAAERLDEAGLRPAGPPEQVSSWNLSSVWRVPLDGERAAWLKHVPPFLGHEGAVIGAHAGGPVPRLIAHDGARILMDELPGRDLHAADEATLERLVDLLVGLQAGWLDGTAELLALGLPDWRGPALTAAIREVIERWRHALAPEVDAALDAFATHLPDRFAAIEHAGIPDTLVHGDFHPGNARGDAVQLALLDWGDSGVGHPALDQAAYLDRVPPSTADGLRSRWDAAWRRVRPGSDPTRAARLLRPIAAARQAVIYQGFLDRIEPSEHPYHRDDPVDWLTRTADLVPAE